MGEARCSAASGSLAKSRRGRRSERGQSAAELAILLPLVLLLLVAVIEVNSALHAYITVVSASRDGARLGSTGAATSTDVQALVLKDMANLPNGTTQSNITVSFPTVASMNSVRVRTCYNYSTFLKVPL